MDSSFSVFRVKKRSYEFYFHLCIFKHYILNKGVPGKYPTRGIFHLPCEPLAQQTTVGFPDLGNIIRVIFSHG